MSTPPSSSMYEHDPPGHNYSLLRRYTGANKIRCIGSEAVLHNASPDLERQEGKENQKDAASNRGDPPYNVPRPSLRRVNLSGINFENDHGAPDVDSASGPARGSRPSIWTMYQQRAVTLDHALVESWREDMDSLLLFAAIFAASVTAFVIESYKRLQPDPAELTVTLLLRISGQLSDVNETMLPSLPAPFHPSADAIICNICWFLSLILSLSCALGAILARQWVLNYLQNTQEEPQPHDRARMRHHLFVGISKWRFSTFIETLPVILHASLFLFMIGLCAFVFEANKAITITAAVVFASGLIIYGVLTALPLRHPDCPYQTPLSSAVPFVSTAMKTIWNTITRRATSGTPLLGIRARRKDILEASAYRHKLDLRLFQWLWSLFTESHEILLLLLAVPDFIRSFPENLRDSQVPHSIVLDAISTDIIGLIQSSISSDRGTHVKHSMEAVAVACTGVLSFIAHHSATAASQPQVDWMRYFPFDSSLWEGLRALALQHQQPPAKFNLDLALGANGFMLLVVNCQLERSRGNSFTRDGIATLRKKVFDQLCDQSMEERWSAVFLQEISQLCKMCWLQELTLWSDGLAYYIDGDGRSRVADLLSYIRRLDQPDHESDCKVKWVKYIRVDHHTLDIGRLFRRSLDSDYLLLLYLALSQEWLYVQELSEDQTHLALATMTPIAENARKTFATKGREYTSEFEWFFSKLSTVLHSSTMSFCDLLSRLCAILLFPDCTQRQLFQDKLAHHLNVPLMPTLDIKDTLLDAISVGLRELIIEGYLSGFSSQVVVLKVCTVVGMPRSGDDLRCLLYRADKRGGGPHNTDAFFLSSDILGFRSLWLSSLCKEGTLADAYRIILVLPSPYHSEETRMFFHMLLLALDPQDISFLKQARYLGKWIRDQLPPNQPQPPALPGSISNENSNILATKRIGSRPGWKRRHSMSSPLTVEQQLMLRAGIDPSIERSRSRSFMRDTRPRMQALSLSPARSLPCSWTESDHVYGQRSSNQYEGSDDQFQAEEVWRIELRHWVARQRPEGGDDEDSLCSSSYNSSYGSDSDSDERS